MTDNKSSGGLLNSLTVLASSLVSIAHARLELLSTDLEEDREHLLSLVMLSLVSLFSLMVGVVLVAILLVVVFWETHRLLALASLAGFFLVLGLAACGFAIRKAKTKPRLFLASLLELFKDSQQLGL
jgi:uncharacterized membrane protein YqjE